MYSFMQFLTHKALVTYGAQNHANLGFTNLTSNQSVKTVDTKRSMYIHELMLLRYFVLAIREIP